MAVSSNLPLVTTYQGMDPVVPMSDDAVLVSVVVEATQERAFDVFTNRFGTWWPLESHHISEQDAVDAVIEPRAGGRWFERAADGSECEWGRVLEWDAPARVLLAWHLTPDFVYDPDPARSTQVEVRFVPEGSSSTRVELEHRGFAVHGDRAASMRSAVGSEGGWAGLLRTFAEALARA